MSRSNICKLKLDKSERENTSVEFTTETRCNNRASSPTEELVTISGGNEKRRRGRGRCREDIQEAHVKECKGEYLLAFSRDDKAPRLLCCTAPALSASDSPIPLDFPPSLPPPPANYHRHSISASRPFLPSSLSTYNCRVPSPRRSKERSLPSDISRYVFSLAYMRLHL